MTCPKCGSPSHTKNQYKCGSTDSVQTDHCLKKQCFILLSKSLEIIKSIRYVDKHHMRYDLNFDVIDFEEELEKFLL
jgi:hypothetical protein